MVKKRPPKQSKHLVAAHGAEQDLQTDEAQASVDTEELVSFKVRESILWSLFESVVISLTARMEDMVQPVAFI